jgi:PBP1b-binding outer membrane lipoprotein LpoB
MVRSLICLLLASVLLSGCVVVNETKHVVQKPAAAHVETEVQSYAQDIVLPQSDDVAGVEHI